MTGLASIPLMLRVTLSYVLLGHSRLLISTHIILSYKSAVSIVSMNETVKMSALEKAVSQLVVRGVSPEDARRILSELVRSVTDPKTRLLKWREEWEQEND